MFKHDHRKQPKNIILAGLWYSNEKPHMQVYLKSIVEELLKLESEGMQVVKYKAFYVHMNVN